MSDEIDHTTTDNPNIAFIIERSKNKNLVVYEALYKNGELDPEKPIDVYWLDLESSFVEKRKSKGLKHDRSELIYIEKLWAYGLNYETVIPPEKTPLDHYNCPVYKIKLVAVPSRPVYLVSDPKSKKPLCCMKINDVDCYLKRIWVESKSQWGMIDRCVWVDLFGENIHTGESKTERCIN